LGKSEAGSTYFGGTGEAGSTELAKKDESGRIKENT
jgi:hypothetical protein